MTSLFQILVALIDIAKWIVLAHVIMSWLINFQVLNTRQPLVAQSRLRRLPGGPPVGTAQLLAANQGTVSD